MVIIYIKIGISIACGYINKYDKFAGKIQGYACIIAIGTVKTSL